MPFISDIALFPGAMVLLLHDDFQFKMDAMFFSWFLFFETASPVFFCLCVSETEHDGHSHMTFAVVERSLDGGFSLKALKQKQMVDGLCYLLQEVYGIENKNAQRSRVQ